jgi:hypothetical protein
MSEKPPAAALRPRTNYAPRPDGLPARMIAFFQHNPDEELNLEDISEKFDATRGNIHTLLAEPMRLGLLARIQNDDGEYLYKRGTALPTERQAAPTTSAKPARKSAPYMRKTVDFAALQVEEGIPYASEQRKGENKWHPLFAKLTKPGQSVAIPGELRGAVGAAAAKLNRTKAHGEFRIAMVDRDTARVWRTA